MATVSKSHQIDESAQRIFRSRLPESWVIKKQDPDYHIDYIVEMVDDEELTGLDFHVQLKGSKSIKRKKSSISFPMKTKHLRYYRNKVRRPVFLILVDVKEAKCYWLFVQKYINDFIGDINKVDALKKTVNIPLENVLFDVDVFGEKVVEADKYMRELWPSSIHSAVQEEIKRMNMLDPRIDVDVEFKGEMIRYAMEAKPDSGFSANLSINVGEDELHKIRDMVDYGGAFNFSSGQVSIAGSELLSKLLESNEYSNVGIEFGKHSEKEFELELELAFNSKSNTLSGIEGLLYKGEKGFRFDGELRDSPFSINLIGTYTGDRKFNIRFNSNFDPKKWFGRKVDNLPHFDKLYRFFGGFDAKSKLKFCVTLLKEGNILTGGCADDGVPVKIIQDISEYLYVINQIRTLCRIFNKKLTLPNFNDIKDDELNLIGFLLSDYISGNIVRSGKGMSAQMRMKPSDELLNSLKKGEDVFPDMSVTSIRSYYLFGAHIVDLEETVDMKNMRVENREEYLESVGHSDDGFGNITLIGTETSEIIFNYKQLNN